MKKKIETIILIMLLILYASSSIYYTELRHILHQFVHEFFCKLPAERKAVAAAQIYDFFVNADDMSEVDEVTCAAAGKIHICKLVCNIVQHPARTFNHKFALPLFYMKIKIMHHDLDIYNIGDTYKLLSVDGFYHHLIYV